MKKIASTVICIIAILSISACVRSEDKRGYVTEYSNYTKLKQGMTKDEVQKILGSPSSISSFGDEKWYYIGMKMEKAAFIDPEIIEQSVITIAFNKDGIATNINKKASSGGRDIKFAKDTTPTEGNEIGVMEQLLGNLGRFTPTE